MIRISAKPHDDLNWEKPIAEALAALEKGERITWEFDLGLNQPYFPLEDELMFQTLSSALTLFTKDVWPRFSEATDHAILFRGSADFDTFFQWSEKQEENWSIWKEDRALVDPLHSKRLFCAEAFVAYFQMLAHKLPDELPLKLILDASHLPSFAQTLHLLSPERFEHFQLEAVPLSTSTLGICFPSDPLCSGEILSRIDALLSSRSKPFKPVYEPLLTEQWDGLDYIYVFSSGVTPQGKRKLMGFCAAGGTVITEGSLIGLPQELSSNVLESM